VRVSTTSTACFVKFGQSGVVADTTSGNAIGTNVIDYYAVTPGMQAAVISSGTPGTTPVVTITEMS